MAETKIVVLGAGVIGLTTAHLLSENKNYSITVIAKHMPGDYDIEYTSPWAGANFLPVGGRGSPLQKFETETWPELARLAKDVPEAGIHFQNTELMIRDKDIEKAKALGAGKSELFRTDAWYKDVVPDFRVLNKDQLPSGIDSGVAFTSVCINTPVYLAWLVSQSAKKGVVFKRGIAEHVSDAADLHHSKSKADIVVNCTGIGAVKLGGVADSTVYPARGQIVVVRNEPGVMTSYSGTDDDDDEMVYIMNRAAGGGCILGGCFQKHRWESQPDPNLATRIMKRAVQICPTLTGGKGIEELSIIRHGVGLRPVRENGPRLEPEDINGVRIIHHYGHGGYGYQSSYGSTNEAVRLVKESAGR